MQVLFLLGLTELSKAMIIGSGLLARAFKQYQLKLDQVCVYAAGVSNSSNTDAREFEREKLCLTQSMAVAPTQDLFIYFSTCSICDPSMQDSPYVKHKVRMENLVKQRSNYLIFRLPQVVSFTPNPHTLLNALYAYIVRSERFSLWVNATRNLIDVDDISIIALEIISKKPMWNKSINIANSDNVAVKDIVKVLENVLGVTAIYDEIDKGSGYHIDISDIQPALIHLGIHFNDDYLHHMFNKYYGKSARQSYY